MSQCGKCCRLSVLGARDDVDRISALPDELLGYMLSFLPTKCAVSTSVLSSRWRRLYMLTHCLSFTGPTNCVVRKDKPEMNPKKRFKKFVNRVLLFHKVSPIKYFHLLCGEEVYDDSHLHYWISIAIVKGVEQLHLSFNGKSKPLPLCLFTSQTIVELKIHSRIAFLHVPDSANMPSLKILDLKNIHFANSHSFGTLLSACPLLQELEIVSCGWSYVSDCDVCLSSGELKSLKVENCSGKFEVDAPNLIDLKIICTNGMILYFSLKNADSLAMAFLKYDYYAYNSATLDKDTAALVKAVYHVKELSVLGYAIRRLGRSQEDNLPTYPNLLQLTLGCCSYAAWKYVAHWLNHSPRLRTVIFEQGLIPEGPVSKVAEWPSDVELVPFSSRVKVIEASWFRGYTAELSLVKYLLKNASMLKRLALVQQTYTMTRKEERRLNRRLLMFPRASKTCVVRVRGS